MLFLLCISESFTMIAAALMLYDLEVMTWTQAVIFANLTNISGYLKYVYQMYFSVEYIALSFHIYNASFLWISYITMDT